MTLNEKTEPSRAPLTIFNISGYVFFPLENCESYQMPVKNKCAELEIMGSIILSPEGINVMMAGVESKIQEFINFLEQDLKFPPIDYRKSFSKEIPYNRLLIKVKNYIVAGEQYKFGADNGKALEPKEFKKWLDENKEMTVIDVRNDYENRVGKFSKSVDFGSYNFNEFPQIAREKLGHLDRNETIVSICTGGIKTEKASIVLKDMGFKNVFFLKGGIIKYFEECGNDHYQGDCFIFDKRVAIDSKLQETGATMCYNCRAPVSPEEQKSPQYVPEKSCPHCFTRKEQEKISLARRLSRQNANPLSQET